MAYREEGTITLSLLAKDLASGKVGAFVGHLDALAKKGGLVGAVAQGVGQSFGQLLNPLGLASSGIGMVTDLMGDAIGAASDLNESMSKVGVVFGENADDIEDWSKTAATAMGLSQQKALEAAGTFGNLFDAIGLAEDATVEMSRGAVQLAADLGSFNNVPVEEALLAIRSGLLGEAEPMRKFGSALSEARVQAYGMANGLGEMVRSGKTMKFVMSDSEKMTARYRLMLEDTANAQGDFGRTADGVANSTKTLNAQIDDLTADIGQQLLPVVRDLLPVVRDLVGLMKEAAASTDALGTVISVLTGNVADQQRALTDYFASLDPWTRTFHDLGEELGYTRVQVYKLAEQFRSEGKSIIDFGAYLDSLRKPAEEAEEAVVDMGESVGASAGAMPTAVKAAVEKVEHSLSALVGISRTTLRATRSEVRDRMRDIEDALDHPFRDDRLEKEYRSAVRRATRAMNRALRTGNEEAYAEASEFVREYKAKLRELRLQRFRVRVSMFVDDGGVTGPGGVPPGGGGGGAHGYRGAHRVAGGPVSAGVPYVVGEHRPEVFVPSTSGTILPSTRGLGATYVYAPGYSTASPAEAQRFMAAIGPEMDRYLSRRY